MSNHEDTPLFRQRHTLAHVLAEAIQRVQQWDVEVAIWPAIENGLYYDFLFNEDKQISEEDLKTVQDQMVKIVKECQDLIRIDVDAETSDYLVNTLMKQKYKDEMRKEFLADGESISFYVNTIAEAAKDRILEWIDENYLKYYEWITKYLQEKYPDKFNGKFATFLDMCEWPHVENTKEIDPKAFAVSKIAGAYWRWDSNNVMMTRIYVNAFGSKEELKEYLDFIEESKKRDHRILWQKLKLFTISPLVWAGLPLLQPNGMIVRKEIEDYLWEIHKNKWYLRVWTPHIAKIDLYKTSWHAAKFGNELFRVTWKEEEFIMKPMNCPHHMQIFSDNQFSYRDMPIRYFEPATVYRDEKTGQLSGLTRVRSITQDDGHLFCRVDQIKEEVKTITDIIKEFYGTFWMLNDYWVSLSVRWEDKSKYLWSDEVWKIAEESLEEAAKANELPYKRVEWEAAFYGPKLDFMFKDCLWREWQLATIQCDFNLPERFQLEFTNANWERERPVVIHRAISWSLERFLWIIIEHFAGAFPVRLAPEQIRIIPVADAFIDYAWEISELMKKEDLRVHIDDWSDSFSKKIRNAELDKVPYILIVWEKEVNSKWVSVRVLKTKEQYEQSTSDFIKMIVEKRNTRAL